MRCGDFEYLSACDVSFFEHALTMQRDDAIGEEVDAALKHCKCAASADHGFGGRGFQNVDSRCTRSEREFNRPCRTDATIDELPPISFDGRQETWERRCCQ